ncbi:hypothetical protein N619_00385, partial [Ectopseudomonas oleovorans]
LAAMLALGGFYSFMVLFICMLIGLFMLVGRSLPVVLGICVSRYILMTLIMAMAFLPGLTRATT